MQIICLNIHSLIIAEGGAKGPCRPAIEPSRTWQGLTLRKDARVDFAFAIAVRNPFLAGVGSGFNLLFLIARNKLSYCCCLQKHIKKHTTVTRRRPQCRQSYSIGFLLGVSVPLPPQIHKDEARHCAFACHLGRCIYAFGPDQPIGTYSAS